jgi:cytochrome P450
MAATIPTAGEETLRDDPSVPVWRRVTARPVTLGGVSLPEGARIFLWLAAAGRDAVAFSRPDTFDLTRPDSGRHLAFGKGLHYCLGANLGKLETQIAVAALAGRYPRLPSRLKKSPSDAASASGASSAMWCPESMLWPRTSSAQVRQIVSGSP